MDVRAARCRAGRLTAIGALAALVAACGAGDDTAGPAGGVTVDDLQREQYFYEGEHLGRSATVSASVAEVRGPRLFELSGGDSGVETLPVVVSHPIDVEQGQVVRVTGIVGQLHHSPPSDRAPYIQSGLYEKHATEAYLYDATAEPLPANG